jgi:hypothetical protein
MLRVRERNVLLSTVWLAFLRLTISFFWHVLTASALLQSACEQICQLTLPMTKSSWTMAVDYTRLLVMRSMPSTTLLMVRVMFGNSSLVSSAFGFSQEPARTDPTSRNWPMSYHVCMPPQSHLQICR